MLPEAQGVLKVYSYPMSFPGALTGVCVGWGLAFELKHRAESAFREKCANTNSSENRSGPHSSIHVAAFSSVSLYNPISNVCKRVVRIHYLNLSHFGGKPEANSASFPNT